MSRRWILSVEEWLVLAAICLLSICITGPMVIKCIGGANWQFSEGTRSGVIQKLSKRGLYWKTWEGELNLGYMQSVSDGDGHSSLQPAVFRFSVSSDEMAERLKAAEVGGKRVTLEYRQYLLRGYDKGDTEYDIVDVTAAAPQPAPL